MKNKKEVPKVKKTDCKLIKDVTIGDKLVKAGKKVALTDKAIKYFKTKKYIQ